MMICFRVGLALLLISLPTGREARADEPVSPPSPPRLDRVVIDSDFPGAYQVELVDINGDGRLDIVALGGDTCAWYENPDWKKRIIAGPEQTPGIISSAAADLNGDGIAEVAVAYDFLMNQPVRGKLGLAVAADNLDEAWNFVPLADVPSIHRVRWAALEPERPLALVAAPIFGPRSEPPGYNQDQAEVWIFRGLTAQGLPPDWTPESARTGVLRPVMHAIAVVSEPELRPGDQILTADNLGVAHLVTAHSPSRFEPVSLATGAMGAPPRRGCSEIRWGRLASGHRFLATIEPWHGEEVAVYHSEQAVPDATPFQILGSEDESSLTLRFGGRAVIDDTLEDGHALCVADIDRDGDDEIFAGHRGKDHRVSMYDFDGRKWVRTVVDTGVAAQDLRSADLNKDGVPEVVTVGGATHNIVLYQVRP